MQEGRRNVEATGSARYQNTQSNKMDSDRTFYSIDGFRHSVFAKKAHS